MKTEKKVLVVDDDTNLQNLVEETLNYEGYEVVTADNGYSAISMIKEEAPGLIILDLIIPRLDGFKLCKKLKEDIKTRNIPILVISAQTRREVIIELLKLGIKNFLAKPFNVNDLVKRVKELYIQSPSLPELSNLTVKYFTNNDILNIKLAGALTIEDIPILIKNIEQRVFDAIGKVILNVIDLENLDTDEIKMLEEIKNYFEPRNVKIKITAGDSKSLRSNLLIHSSLKENTLVY
ncbi:MAG: response regulator [bacterium]|nr:response regulator [bacterium]